MRLVVKTIAISIAIGLSFGTYLYFTYDHRPVRIALSLLYAVDIGLLMMAAITFRHYGTAWVSNPVAKVVIMIVMLAAAALIGSEITLMLRAFILARSSYVPVSGGSIYILNILIVLVTGVPIYINEELKSVMDSRILNQQYRLLQLEQQNTRFELELLRAKVNPHFLYNVHNTIAGLISQDPAKAEALVMLLSRFFRFTLNKTSATFHTVEDELEIVDTYLRMQCMRYESRMIYTIKAENAIRQLPMPSFILQPLVENAIKHGLEATPGNGYIHISVVTEENSLVLTVSDSGPPFPSTPGTGLGLQLVTDKLRLLYNDNFTLSWHNNPEKYVRITIPSQH